MHEIKTLSNLLRLAVNGKHYLLCQVFGEGQFATARPEERYKLRCKGIQQVSERPFVWASRNVSVTAPSRRNLSFAMGSLVIELG